MEISSKDAPAAATLAPTPVIDTDHPAVVAFASRCGGANERERVVGLCYAVRDGLRDVGRETS